MWLININFKREREKAGKLRNGSMSDDSNFYFPSHLSFDSFAQFSNSTSILNRMEKIRREIFILRFMNAFEMS